MLLSLVICHLLFLGSAFRFGLAVAFGIEMPNLKFDADKALVICAIAICSNYLFPTIFPTDYFFASDDSSTVNSC